MVTTFDGTWFTPYLTNASVFVLVCVNVRSWPLSVLIDSINLLVRGIVHVAALRSA